MSPSWRDRLQIALAADRVTAVRFGRGIAPRVVDKTVVACPEMAGGRPWAAAIAALKTLADDAGKRPADATIILSNRFVRYAVIPWSDQLDTPREELAFTRHCFAKIYGAADNWELRISSGGLGDQRVASAVDSELIGAIRDLVAGSRVRIVSVQPYLMTAFNLWRRRLHAGDCMFVVGESRTYACAVLRGRKWQSVRVGAIAGRLADELPSILDREYVWAGLAERLPVFVHCPEARDIAVPPGVGWTVTALTPRARPGYSPLSEPEYAMAISVT